ncbi:MAG: hypothetical protein IJT41_07335 [Clostridia bacterium]|nr:hypothetical protein [Clostridia bacterium]
MRSAFAGSHPALNFLFFASVVAFGMLFFHPAMLGISFAAALSYSIRPQNGIDPYESRPDEVSV